MTQTANARRRTLRWYALRVLLLGVAVLGAGVLTLWTAFGRGKPYPDLSEVPRLGASELEVAAVSQRPVGNAAVSAGGRLFFTVHPESRPEPPFLYEWREGRAIPYPDAAQEELFETPLGLVVDAQERLWVIDPGTHGFGAPRLLAFDLATDTVVHDHEFARDVAPRGSFLQDLQIDAEGRYVYIADVGFWFKRPALVVYDTETERALRRLERHESVYPQNLLIRTPIRDMSYFGGIVQMKTGVDGVALSRDGEWLYYAAMNHDAVFRLRAADLRNGSLTDEQLVARIERIGPKPLSDGLSIDTENGVFITDVEHGAVLRLDASGRLETVVKDERIRWADGLSFGPEGWLYLADSAIPHLALQSPESIARHAPFMIWRFRPGTVGAPGQ